MTGGIIQLSYIGADIFIKNPQVTFFKSIYHKYTNFAISQHEIFSTNKFTNFGQTIDINIDKIGDLLNAITVKVIINDSQDIKWIKRLGFFIFETIQIQIGGKTIDTHSGIWYDIWYEIYRNRHEEMLKFIDNHCEIYLPLRFWFNTNIGASIPIIALQYQDISIRINFSKLEHLIRKPTNKNVVINSVSLICDHIFLDLNERKRVASSDYEYIIQVINIYKYPVIRGFNTFNIKLRSNVKELYWVVQQYKKDPQNYGLTKYGDGNPLIKAKILFNGQERVRSLKGNYYNYAVPYSHHKCIPKDGLNMYSFAIYPDIHQPSGFANFSYLNNIILEAEYGDITECQATIICESYRIFKIGYGLAYLVEKID
jgi:hypothetical protein